MELVLDGGVLDDLFNEAACKLKQADVASPPLSQVNRLDTVRLPSATSHDVVLVAAIA